MKHWKKPVVIEAQRWFNLLKAHNSMREELNALKERHLSLEQAYSALLRKNIKLTAEIVGRDTSDWS